MGKSIEDRALELLRQSQELKKQAEKLLKIKTKKRGKNGN
jgi:hypothetical protein